MKKLICLLALLCGLVSTVAAGPVLAVDFVTASGDFTNDNWSLGWQFNVNTPIVVTGLGFYDDQQNGLAQSHDVGIWNSVGVLLVWGTVSPADPLVSWWRWTSVTPVTLAVGEGYQIGAVTGAENYSNGPGGFTTDPSITFVGDSYYYPAGSGLAYPNSSVGGVTGWFGPNFEFSVPEPASFLLLAPILGLLFLRRRK